MFISRLQISLRLSNAVLQSIAQNCRKATENQAIEPVVDGSEAALEDQGLEGEADQLTLRAFGSSSRLQPGTSEV